MIRSQAVLIAIRMDWEGRRDVLAVELADRESLTRWKEFALGLKKRGLKVVGLAITDEDPGLRGAIREVFSEAMWQRRYIHFLRSALDL